MEINTDHAANIAIWVAIAIAILVVLCVLDCVFRWTGRCWSIISMPFRCCFNG